MRLKEYPEIILDDIPKLYESHTKVFITHLYRIEEQVKRLPTRFCKMYTTHPLASQLLEYFRNRGADISMNDFCIVEEMQPLKIHLSNGKRLEVMLCAGNELGNTLMLLIRKLCGGSLLYYYSAVQQDDLCNLMGNETYMKWIAAGTEVLYLNLQAADEPFEHYDFEEAAKEIQKQAIKIGTPLILNIPNFGYEYLIKRLSETFNLFGHIKMFDKFLSSYLCLSTDLRHFEQPEYQTMLHIYRNHYSDAHMQSNLYPLSNLKWSPIPNRVNLIQLCSLLSPKYINGIVCFHETGNAPPVPSYLKRFKSLYNKYHSPNSNKIFIPDTQLAEEGSDEIAGAGNVEVQAKRITPNKCHQNVASRKDQFLYTKTRKLQFVNSDDDSEGNDDE